MHWLSDVSVGASKNPSTEVRVTKTRGYLKDRWMGIVFLNATGKHIRSFPGARQAGTHPSWTNAAKALHESIAKMSDSYQNTVLTQLEKAINEGLSKGDGR